MFSARRLLWIATFLALALLSLSACGGDEALSESVRQESAQPPDAGNSLEEAVQVAEDVSDGVGAGRHATMYGLISPNSRDAYPEDAFSAAYGRAAETMTLQAVETRTTNTLRQDTIATVLYDATFTTEFFGAFEDRARTLRLVETPEGWRVAWSRRTCSRSWRTARAWNGSGCNRAAPTSTTATGWCWPIRTARAVELRVVKRDVPDQAACIAQLARILDKTRRRSRPRSTASATRRCSRWARSARSVPG